VYRGNGSRKFSMGIDPGSRGSLASHGLMNEGGRDRVVGREFGIMLGLMQHLLGYPLRI
jgi:hypothetical protein